MNPSIAFIGGGNMASSLIGGLIAGGTASNKITVAEPDSARCHQLAERYGINTSRDNTDMLSCDVVVLAVKPQIMQTVCRDLANSERVSTPLYISIAAGLHTGAIERWLGTPVTLVRCMPNTPALLQCGATGMFANARVDGMQRAVAEQILQTAGITAWVADENQLDAITALSGSGPAYFFLLMEAMQATGVELGLDAATARRFTLQTALGAARMASESGEEPAELRARVTSKGGTTERAIDSFTESGFQQQVQKALRAAHSRSRELAEQLGKDTIS
jgi:pyrroline-5-carboxylate reductase